MRYSRVIFGLVLFCATPALQAGPFDKDPDSCGNHETSVEFLDTPSEAARKALKEEKLVFVLHVSGNFENPNHT